MIALHSRPLLRLSTLLPALAALFAFPLLLLMPADAQARERVRGDWERSCKNADLRGDWLEADCRKYSGGWRRNTRINYDACPGNEVTVRDGHLVCERRNNHAGWNGHNGWGNNSWNNRGWDDRWDRDRWDGRGHGHYQQPGRVVRDGRVYVWNGRQYVLADSHSSNRHWNNNDRDRKDWDRKDWDRKDGNRKEADRRDWNGRRDDDRRDGDRDRSRDRDRDRDNSREEWWKRGNG